MESQVKLTEDEVRDGTNSNGDWDPQCKVTTRKGKRCSNSIFTGQQHYPVKDKLFLLKSDYDTFRTGSCTYHRWLEARTK